MTAHSSLSLRCTLFFHHHVMTTKRIMKSAKKGFSMERNYAILYVKLKAAFLVGLRVPFLPGRMGEMYLISIAST